jgi:hypothetical protein
MEANAGWPAVKQVSAGRGQYGSSSISNLPIRAAALRSISQK